MPVAAMRMPSRPPTRSARDPEPSETTAVVAKKPATPSPSCARSSGTSSRISTMEPPSSAEGITPTVRQPVDAASVPHETEATRPATADASCRVS